MNHYRLILIFLSTIVLRIQSQNLVWNGGFENAASCPLDSRYDFFFSGPCVHWTGPKDGTADYYHRDCAFAGSPTTTNNSLPFEGKAFTGIYVSGKFGSTYNREYIQGALKQPLKAGTVYFVSFRVKPVLASAAGIDRGIAEIGAYLGDSLISFSNSPDLLLRQQPQVVNQGRVINDTSQWFEVKGCFTAIGGEQYICIGNFFTDEANTIAPLTGNTGNPSLGYVLIDDVQVLESATTELLSSHIGAICQGDTVKLQAAALPSARYVWNTGDTGRALNVTAAGNYKITCTSREGCRIEDSINLLASNCNTCHFWLPDAFTPDDNTRNEEFRLVSDCAVKAVRMRILNRWGEVVLDNTGKQPSWDGSFRGVRAPQGVYVYLCEVLYEQNGNIQRQTLNGTVTLIR